MEPSSETEVNLENPLVSLEWKDYTTLPVGMQHAQAVVLGDKVYIGGGVTTDPEMETNIYVFDHTKESPDVTSIRTPGPTRWSTLATFRSQLVIAGGVRDHMTATNELWALSDDGCEWEQPFPPMPQACWGATALSSGDYLILAGGVKNHPSNPLETVQIYNANSKLSPWGFAQPLPKSCYFMKGVLHNGDWYLAGGRWQYEKVYHTSVETLIEKRNVWKSLPDLSRRRCCSISVCQNQLIALGAAINTGPTREIRVYSTGNKSWIKVEHLPEPCDSICTIHLPTKDGKQELLLIGGCTGNFSQNFSNKVIKANIKEVHSLDDNFSLPALAHIEMVSRFEIFHSLACVQMNDRAAALLQRDDSTGQKSITNPRALFNKWLTGKSENTKPATWKVLVELFRNLELNEVAQNIEQLFTRSAPASEGGQLKLVTKEQQSGLVLSPHDNFRGAEIIAETCCHISGEKPLTYEWSGYGIRIQVPKGALPPDVTSADLRIKASLAGQYEFPEDCELVSGIFWISFPYKFQSSALLDIQHCLALTHPGQCSSLSFVVAKCTQKSLPYRFKLLEGGIFTPHSSYGSISVTQFSGVGIVRKRRHQTAPEDTPSVTKVAKTNDDEGDAHVSYSAQVYYLLQGINKWLLHFLIIKNLKVYNKAIRQEYTRMDAEQGPCQEVFFEADKITLDISKNGTSAGGWFLFPLMHPGLTRKNADTYKPGQQIPSCQIELEWIVREERPAKLRRQVQMIGAKEPNNYFAITRDPTSEDSGIPTSSVSQATPINRAEPELSEPELSSLMNEVAAEVPDKWRAIGTQLELKQSVIESFSNKYSGDSNQCFTAIFTAWKDRRTRPYTWATIIEVLESPAVGETCLAEELKLKVTRTI